jgi:hypothetical protein
MNVRRALALSALLGFAVPLGVSQAATAAPACRLLTDAAGDSTLAPAAPNIGPTDILSGDIASGPHNLIGVLRLASLATDPQTAGGSTYSLTWTANGTAQGFHLTVYADGSRSASFVADESHATDTATDATVALDTSTSSITWSVTRKTDPVLKTSTRAKPVKLSGLSAAAAPGLDLNTGGSFSLSLNGDSASGGKAYLDSTRTCVKGT